MRRFLATMAVAAAVAAGGSALAQTLTPPSVKTRIEAAYPAGALRDRLEGSVGLEITVDAEGRVVDARVTAPAGHGFDEAALAAVKAFTFDPARKDGAAIRSTVQLAYAFHLPTKAVETPPAPVSPPPPSPLPTQRGPDQSTLVLAERPIVRSEAPPERNAASDSSTGQAEMSLHPRYRAEGMLDVVPGLFSVQHAGGGKAQQDFARGFNLDHGTDMAFFVDGAPINAVSHAHGQGYSDLHFLIPETVSRIDSTKGTYATDVGDFGTAGSVTFRMADHLKESVAKVELAPSTGHERLVVVESPDFGDRWRMAIAVEGFHENGPFIHPEDFGRLNGYVKATRVLDDRSELSAMLMAYGGSWNMSGVLPARAVCGEGDGTPTPAQYAGSHCLSRWDSVDPTQGGAAQRLMASLQYRRRFDTHWDLAASAYTLRSSLALFPNDPLYADVTFQGQAGPSQTGEKYGAQIEQDDVRTQSGADVRLTHRDVLAGMPVRTTMGLQLRADAIDAELHRTEARVRLDGKDPAIPGPIYDGHTDETEIGAFAEQEWRPARWLRFLLGARADRVDVTTSNQSPTALLQVSGYKGQAQLSPKAAAVVSPVDAWDLFADYGRGFHTNDARTLLGGQATTLIVPARGYELGTTVRPVPGLSVSAMGFLIDLESELVIDGDTASLSAAGSTRRYGAEVAGRYELGERLYADLSFTTAHGRFTDAADVAAGTIYLPDAPIRTFSAAVGGRQPVGPITLVGSVTVRSMSSRYGDQGPAPLVETGWTVVNTEAGVRWKRVDVVAELLNAGDVRWREGQFEVSSRLPGETAPPSSGISFTPGLPRTLVVRGSLHW